MRGLIGVIGALVFSVFSSVVQAETCIPKSEMQEIARDFRQFQSIAQSEYCLDGSQVAALIETLVFMRKMQLSDSMQPSQDQLFSGRFASDWNQYFKERISDIQIERECRKGVAAFVYGFGSTMHVCPMMLKTDFSALDRASIFMHEARHMDGYGHITCRGGARDGLQGACDQSISEGGSYAVSVETFAQLGRYATDLHPALRAYAQTSAAIYAAETFNTPARVDLTEGLLLVSDSKEIFRLDPKDLLSELSEMGSMTGSGRIVMRSQMMILFSDSGQFNGEYLFTKNAGTLNQVPPIINEFNQQPLAVKQSFQDAHYGGLWSVTVYQDRLVFMCNPHSDQKAELRLPAGEVAVGFVYLDGYNRANKNADLLTASGKVYDLSCRSTSQPSAQPKALKFDQDFKRMYKVAGKTLGLTKDGYLYDVSADGKSIQRLQTKLDGRIQDIAPHQVYQFFEQD